MLNPTKIRKASTSGNEMNAMIDVVFLLLVYFVFTASFSAAEKDLDVNLPRGSTIALKQTRKEKDLEPIRIYVRSRNEFQCNGVTCADATTLLSKLRSLRRLADVPVIIDGDFRTRFGVVIVAMNMALKAKFTRISFAGSR